MVQKELLLSVRLEVGLEPVLNMYRNQKDRQNRFDRRASSRQWSPRSVRCAEAISEVEDLIVSQEDKPQSHSTQREISRQLNISLGSVNRIVKQDLRLKCFKKCRATELRAANKIARLERSKQLLKRYPATSLLNFIFFTDEKLFTIARSSNSQNDRLYDGMELTK